MISILNYGAHTEAFSITSSKKSAQRALAVVYLVFFRKKPAVVRSTASPSSLSAPVPVAKVFSSAAQVLKVRLGLEETNRPISIALSNNELMTHSQYASDLPRLVKVLEELAHVYLIIQVTSDEEERIVHETIQKLMPDFPKHRCLVYSLDLGKVAIVRQVVPSVHIEYDRTFCEKLKPHVRKIIWVNGDSVGRNVSVVQEVPQAESNVKSSDTDSGFTTVATFGEILCL